MTQLTKSKFATLKLRYSLDALAEYIHKRRLAAQTSYPSYSWEDLLFASFKKSEIFAGLSCYAGQLQERSSARRPLASLPEADFIALSTQAKLNRTKDAQENSEADGRLVFLLAAADLYHNAKDRLLDSGIAQGMRATQKILERSEPEAALIVKAAADERDPSLAGSAKKQAFRYVIGELLEYYEDRGGVVSVSRNDNQPCSSFLIFCWKWLPDHISRTNQTSFLHEVSSLNTRRSSKRPLLLQEGHTILTKP